MDRFGRREIRELLVAGACVALLLIYLLGERMHIGKRISRIPLRIGVTGTRGKSSVVRLIAACLRESRVAVVAKTTGARPCLIFPDGTEKEIRRRGLPTILEGKKILKAAVDAGAHAVVLEMMSIRPESLFAESVQMMKPHILVITNVRLDHVEEIGKTKHEIARAFASAIPVGSTVFLPEEEFDPVFRKQAGKAGAGLILVPPEPSGGVEQREKDRPVWACEQNIRTALAVSDFFKIDREAARRALRQAAPDFGALRIWRAEKESPVSGWVFVSAFAANDPESTRDILAGLENRGLFEGRRRIGLLNLREDRGGRTEQWFDALKGEPDFGFDRLVFTGAHAPVLRNRLRGRVKPEITALRAKTPEDVIVQMAAGEKAEAVVFGMGNMGGLGRRLVEYWERTGIPYDS